MASRSVTGRSTPVEEPLSTPQVESFYYSGSHDRWFWRVSMANPAPMRCGRVTDDLTESGCSRHHRWAEWQIKRATRRLARRYARAVREVARS